MSTFSRAAGISPRCPLGAVVVVIAALYLGREFIIPIVLAALIAFSLSPVVRWLEKRRCPRLLSVLSVSFAVTMLLGMIGWVVVSQMTDFAGQLPQYRTNLLNKVEELKSQSRGPWSGAAVTISEVAERLEETAGKMVGSKAPQGVLPVQVVTANTSAMKEMGLGLASVAGPFGTTAIVAVLVIFMLLARDSLRDRMVHLAVRGRVRITHQATAEAGRRVSRYLLAQTVVNVLYGGMVWGAMALVGVPNAPLWGLVGAVLRYLPYLGPVIAFVLPFAVSLAVAPTWAIPLWVSAAFIVIEIIVNNILEPLFYSSSTGLSPLAIIVSAMFWAWLWGPLGLVLATPLTVCALVLGKQIPALHIFYVLLSDDPPITPAERFYQRLVADNGNEALKVIEEVRDESTLTEALDEFVLPAAVGVHAAVDDGDIELAVEERTVGTLRRLLPKIEGLFAEEDDVGTLVSSAAARPVLIVPVGSATDSIVSELLECALHAKNVSSQITQHGLLRSEKAAAVCAGTADVAVLVASAEDSARAARALVRDISAQRTNVKIHVLLVLSDPDKQKKWRDQLSRSGVSDVATSLTLGVKNVLAWTAMLSPDGAADLQQKAPLVVLDLKPAA